jgi:hypothetical protein
MHQRQFTQIAITSNNRYLMISKDLLITILSFNDNLYNVIDMLIENNYEHREEYFKTVIKLSLITKDELTNIQPPTSYSSWPMYIMKKIPFSILFIFYIDKDHEISCLNLCNIYIVYQP